MVKKRPLLLEYASEALRGTIHVVLAALYGGALRLGEIGFGVTANPLKEASTDIQANKKVVLVAVTKNGLAL